MGKPSPLQDWEFIETNKPKFSKSFQEYLDTRLTLDQIMKSSHPPPKLPPPVAPPPPASKTQVFFFSLYILMKRTIKFGRARSPSRSRSSSPASSPSRSPTAYNKFKRNYTKKLLNTSSNNNNNLNVNYAGVEYNKPYFLVGNMIISRHSMYGAINQTYGRPTPNKNKNIVSWIKAQKANNSRKNLIFIVNPITRKVYTAGNVRIIP